MPEIKVPPTEAGTQQQTERERTIASIRAFADWLEANPDVPLQYLPPFQYSILDGSDEERVAEARRVAELVGAEAKADGNRIGFRHLTESGIEYVVHGFTELGNAKYNEEQAALSAFRKARAEKAAEADEPRVWRSVSDEDDTAPEGVTEVQDREGDRWRVTPDGAWFWGSEPDGLVYNWGPLVRNYGPLTEVVPPAQDGAR